MIKHTYDSGLRVLLEPVSTVRSVTIGVWVKTGSRNEKKHINGISHFIEHMLFKGTRKRNAKQIAEDFDALGAHVNAFTSKEYTCFYTQVLDTYKEEALEILSDMFFESTFPENEITREKKVVIEEIKMYDDTPDDHVHDLLAQAMYEKHPLGRPIIGHASLINQFNKESILAYMDTHYTPQNVVISVAGNIDETFLETIEKYFDRFKHHGQLLSLEKPDFGYHQLHKHKETEQVHLCYGFEGFSIADDKMPQTLIMSNIFGGGMSSRLFQEVRENKGLAYAVYAFHAAHIDSGYLTIYAGTTNEQLPELEATIQEAITSFRSNGITEKELKNAKAQLTSNTIIRLESTNSLMTRNARNELLLGKHKSVDEIIEEIDGISTDMIQETIDEVFAKDYAKAMVSPMNQN